MNPLTDWDPSLLARLDANPLTSTIRFVLDDWRMATFVNRELAKLRAGVRAELACLRGGDRNGRGHGLRRPA